ncbi:hypothetical protein Tco_0125120 [Tanacetum coccineum]
MNESQSYLTATEHRECYDGLIKSYDLDKSLFSTYDKMYSLKRSRKDKDKDEDPSAGLDRGLKKRIWVMMMKNQEKDTADKPLKTFDEMMSTPIDFSVYIMNGLKITNLI